MKRKSGLCYLILALTMMCSSMAAAQTSEAETARGEKQATCPGSVYKAKNVSRQAKILLYPRPAGDAEGEQDGEKKGRVVLRAVLCRTGEVTDIEVVEGLPDGLTEKAVEAARRIKFTPAERRGQKVSQRALIEYTFKYVN